jgi:chromosome segregation ATPase
MKIEVTELIKEMHNNLIESSGLEHDEAKCEICLASSEDSPGGTVSDTFTKEEVDAKVAEALAPLQAKLDELEAEKSESAIDAKVAEAKKEAEEQIAAVQKELDEAKIAQSAAEEQVAAAQKSLTDTIAYLEAEKEAAEAAEAIEAKKAERVESVKEAASFDEEYLTANAERWAKMDEELFTATLEEYKVLSAKAGKKTESKLPNSTVLETASQENGETSKLGVLAELRSVGFDARRKY